MPSPSNETRARSSSTAVRQVLAEAAEHEHFFDLSDAERLNWIIVRAFQIGKAQRHLPSNHIYAVKSAPLDKLKKKRSKPMRRQRRSAAARRRVP